jgi:hypothetical protein
VAFGGSRDEHSGRPFGANIVRMANGPTRSFGSRRSVYGAAASPIADEIIGIR